MTGLRWTLPSALAAHCWDRFWPSWGHLCIFRGCKQAVLPKLINMYDAAGERLSDEVSKETSLQ